MRQANVKPINHENFAPFGQFYTYANDCTVVDLTPEQQFEVVL